VDDGGGLRAGADAGYGQWLDADSGSFAFRIFLAVAGHIQNNGVDALRRILFHVVAGYRALGGADRRRGC